MFDGNYGLDMNFREAVNASYRRYLLRNGENGMDYDNYKKAAGDKSKSPESLGLYKKDGLKNFFMDKGYSDYRLTKSESIYLAEKRVNLSAGKDQFFFNKQSKILYNNSINEIKRERSRIRDKNDMINRETINNEMIKYVKDVELDDVSTKNRYNTIEPIKTVIGNKYPDANVILFGSYAQGLSIKSSDLDFTIERELSIDLNDVKGVLDGKFNEINIIEEARVPIIKAICNDTKIHFYISIIQRGKKAAESIKNIISNNLTLKYVFIVLKKMLSDYMNT